jgi:hypothetical protein
MGRQRDSAHAALSCIVAVGLSRYVLLKAAQPQGVFDDESQPENRGCEEQGVDAVEDAAVAGEHVSGVFDAGSAFDCGFEEIAELSGNVEYCGEDEGLPDGLGDVKDEVSAGGEEITDPDDEGCGQDTADDGGDGAFPGFAGAEAGSELVFAEGSAYVEGGGVSGPDADHEEEEQGWAVFLFPEERDEREGVGDPDEAEEALGGVRKDLDKRREESIPGEEREGEGAEDGKLGFEGEVGQGDDEGQHGAEGHPPDGDSESGSMGLGTDGGQPQIFVGGELGDDGGEERDHP